MGSFLRNKSVLIGLLLLLPVLTLVTLGPIYLTDPLAINVKGALQSPSVEHLLGTDLLGRDVLARLCYGGRNSLLVSFAAVAGALLAGLAVGFIAGWAGGWADSLLDRFLEVFICIPGIMLALLLVLFLGKGITAIAVALAVTGAVYIARLAKAETQLLKPRGFVEAAVLYGIPGYRIFLFHLLPNFIGPILAYCVVLLGTNILSESALSFLGLGVQPPEPSWGGMLFESRNFLTSHPWMALAPATAIFMTVLAFNLLAEGVHAYLEPASRVVRNVSGGTKCDREPVRS